MQTYLALVIAGTALMVLEIFLPGGFATLGGRRVDVVTRGDEIPAGTRVRVVEVEGNRVVVARA